MRTIFISLITTLILGNISIKNDLKEDALKGKVKTISYYSNQNPTKYSRIKNYNRRGYLTEDIFFDFENIKIKKTRKINKAYKYNTNNSINTVEYTDSIYNSDNYSYLSSREVEKYNKQGGLVSLRDYHTLYNREENRPYDPYKDVCTRDTTIYNKELNTKTTYRYASDDILLHYWIEKYNDRGNRLKTNLFLRNDSLSIEHIYNNRDLEEILIVYGDNKKDTLHKYISKYDNLDNLIEYIKYENYNKKGDKYNYTYKFDKNKNWIECSESRQGIIIDHTKRDITYY